MAQMTPELLIELAKARREQADNEALSDRQIIEHQALVMEAIANVIAGRVDWDDLVADYAPSWRWLELGCRYGNDTHYYKPPVGLCEICGKPKLLGNHHK